MNQHEQRHYENSIDWRQIYAGCHHQVEERSPVFAASVASAQLLHISGVVRFVSFGVVGHEPVPVWCDNEVTVLVSTDASPIKRLAYIARRVRLLQELDRYEIVKLHDVPGLLNPADIMTKHLTSDTFARYMSIIYNCSVEFLSAVAPKFRPRPIGSRSGGGCRSVTR